MFIAELSIIATNWKQLRFPVIREKQYGNGIT